MRIKKLSPLVANQIAAGEVIERPASVLKELLENSIDAGAKQINIYLEKSGKRLIRVSDDGGGIHKDDLPLALTSHATSKLTTSQDLQAIASLGFRGEALASIAAVSRFNLRSCQQQADQGWQIQVEGRDMQAEISPCAIDKGTDIEVRDLFFNLPARRKFLRTDKTELMHIEECFKRMALSHFEVTFILYHQNKEIYRLPAANDLAQQQKRITRLCGSTFLNNATHINVPQTDVNLQAWLGSPDTARSQSDLQYFFLNGRAVKDRLLNHAVREAYADSLYPGRYPSYIIYLDLDPKTVDVNVHPTKHEVRFHEPRMVHDFLVQQLQQALLEPETIVDTKVLETTEHKINQARPSYFPTSHSPANHSPKNYLQSSSPKINTIQTHSFGKLLTLINNQYLVTQADNSLWLVDLIKAKTILLTNQISQALNSNKLPAKPLLLPSIIKLDAKLLNQLEQRQSLLLALGFEVQQSGPEQVLLRTVPIYYKKSDNYKTIIEYILTLKANHPTEPALINYLAIHISQSLDWSDTTMQNGILAELENLDKKIINKCCRCLQADDLRALIG